VAGVLVVGVSACNKNATPEAQTPETTTPDEVTPAAGTDVAVTSVALTSEVPAATFDPVPAAPPRASGKRSACVFGQDQTCNADPSVSALSGKCLETGVCECNPDFVLAPTGYCQRAE
jgi:hypothetical protein